MKHKDKKNQLMSLKELFYCDNKIKNYAEYELRIKIRFQLSNYYKIRTQVCYQAWDQIVEVDKLKS